MKHVAINFIPKAEVKFSRRELALLLRCSANHYDSHCKSVGQPGVGSFLYGMWNYGAKNTHTLSVRELDTLCKILEVGNFLPELRHKQDACGLGLELRRVLIQTSDRF